MNQARLRVAVLVDLERGPRAGGHVKTWERLAEAAARADHGIDLSIHVQGEEGVEALGPRTRFIAHRPVFSTRRLPFLSRVSDHTDLAPYHPRLARELNDADVIHTTDAYFAMARTAARVARRRGLPYVTSLHTDTPALTRVHAGKVLIRIFGDGVLGRLFVDRLKVPERQATGMERRLTAHGRGAAMTLVGEGTDIGIARARFGPRVAVLRRGIDRARFSPARRDRALLAALGIPPGAFVLFFCGRIEAAKSPLVLAHAARALIDQGRDVRVLLAGEGQEADAVRAILGERAHLPGNLPQDRLAAYYASSDLFVFPSQVEVTPNVVIEAKASGLPVVVAPRGGGKFVRENGRDGIIVDGDDPAEWATVIAKVMDEPALRARLAQDALDEVARHPGWDDVLAQDLVPVWRAA